MTHLESNGKSYVSEDEGENELGRKDLAGVLGVRWDEGAGPERGL